MALLVWLGIFVLIVLLIGEGNYMIRAIWKPELKQVQRRLRALSSTSYSNETIDIIKKKTLSEVPFLNRLLLKIRFIQRFEIVLEQADTAYPISFYILLSLIFLTGGGFAVSFCTKNSFIWILTGMGLSTLPWFHIYRKRRKRMIKFEHQLPDALELVARSMMAGHAFTGGLKMVGEEFDDPVGTEFEKTLNEINFGIGIPDALRNLSRRIDCPDLKFFIISVIIQRETGGNLAEILENLGMLIRERFKLQGRIRVLSSEGKFSAIVLIALPFFVVAALSVINPKYINVLFQDSMGKFLVTCSLLGMGIGIAVMKKMIRIRV
jgi:tight adherence protein B